MSVVAEQTKIRKDSVNASIKYVGTAPCGAAETDALWSIMRITDLGNDEQDIQYADGNQSQDKIFNNRESLEYK